jgi:hypothetical protein
MGSLDDPKLSDIHEQITRAFYWQTPPDHQKVCELLNGLSMEDMLDELWRINTMGRLDGLVHFVTSAKGVNIDRLRAAMGAVQKPPPQDFNALVLKLPADQQRAIKSVVAVTQAPDLLNPLQFSSYYSQIRLVPRYLPPPKFSKSGDRGDANAGGSGGDDDDEAHLAADVATALTANAPRGMNPMTYTVTVVYRNFDVLTFGKKDSQVAVGHEPNVSVQISPDPNNPVAYQAAMTLINVHLKRHWGLVKPDVEFSISGQASIPSPGGPVSGGVQSQVEVHVTTKISVTAGASLGFGPPIKPGDPPDRGAIHGGNQKFDMAFTPFMIGILGHWDPPSK